MWLVLARVQINRTMQSCRIPAPIAYTNAVAVKKLVVGFRAEGVLRASPVPQSPGSACEAVVLVLDSTPGIQPSLFIHGTDGLRKDPSLVLEALRTKRVLSPRPWMSL